MRSRPAVGATLARSDWNPSRMPTSLVRRHLLLGVLAASGAIVVAACSSNAGDGASSTTAPSRTTVAPTTTTLPPVTYEVQRGDTLTSIAERFGLSPAVIATANQLSNADQLTEGQVLTIPPAPPPEVTITPNVAPSGQTLTFTLTGAKAGETVTFEINAPNGDKFTGQPHTASQDGEATTSYNSTGDDPGVYRVVATGDRGTTAQAPYLVRA
jgi:LysM repeat protein